MSNITFGQEKYFPFRGKINVKDFFYLTAKPNKLWDSSITNQISSQVNPDNTLFIMCMNSFIKSGKKHIRFFWSCDPEDFIVNYNADTKCIGPVEFLHKNNGNGKYSLYYRSLINITNIDQRYNIYPVSPVFNEVLSAGQENGSFAFSQAENYNLVPNTLYTGIPYRMSENIDFYWRRDYVNGRVSPLRLNYISPSISSNISSPVVDIFLNLETFQIEFKTNASATKNITWNPPGHLHDNVLKVNMSIMIKTDNLGPILNPVDDYDMIPKNGGTIIVSDNDTSIIEAMTYTNFALQGNVNSQTGNFLGVKRNFMANSGQYTANENIINWGTADSGYKWSIFLKNNNTHVLNGGTGTFNYDSNFIQPTSANVTPKIENNFYDVYLVPSEKNSYLPSLVSISNFSYYNGAPLSRYYDGNYFRVSYNYKTGLAERNMDSKLRFFTNVMEGYIAQGTWKTINNKENNFVSNFNSNGLAFPNGPITSGKQTLVMWTTMFDATHQIFYDYCKEEETCGFCMGYTGNNFENCVVSNNSQKRYVNSYVSTGSGTRPFFYATSGDRADPDLPGLAGSPDWKKEADFKRDIYCSIFGVFGGIILILTIIALVYVGNSGQRWIEICAELDKNNIPLTSEWINDEKQRVENEKQKVKNEKINDEIQEKFGPDLTPPNQLPNMTREDRTNRNLEIWSRNDEINKWLKTAHPDPPPEAPKPARPPPIQETQL